MNTHCEKRAERTSTKFESGNFERLGAFKYEKELIMAGRRINEVVPLLLKSSKLGKLAKNEAYQPVHLGVSATASKVRTKYWSLNRLRIIKSVLKFCTGCRLCNEERASELISSATEERLNPSLPFTNLCFDLVGPYNARSNLKKTSHNKIYAVIFICLFSRAVHLDIVIDYSTKEFLQTIRTFVSPPGSPEVIHSDSGTQLVGAKKALQGNFKIMNEDFLIKEFNFKRSLISSVKYVCFFLLLEVKSYR